MITRADIDTLSQLKSDRWPIVSLYLRVDKERIDEDYTIRLKNLLRQTEDHLDHRFDHEQTEAVLADLERIKEFFRDEANRFGRGVAVFVSSNAGIWHVYELPRDVESLVTVDFEPNVGPLIRLLDQLDPLCVCLIARNSARIFYGTLSEIEELDSLFDEDVPGQHEQGGWSQARYERHIEEHVRTHFKHVAETLFALFEKRPFRWFVLGGPDEVVSAFIGQLHPYLRERHVGTIRLLMESNINEVRQESAKLIERWLHDEKARAIEMLRNETLSEDRGAAGLEPTITAVQQGQVLTMIVDSGFAAPGVVCRNCGVVQLEPAADDTCAYCGGRLERLDDIVPTLITRGFQQGAAILLASTPDLQEELAGLGRVGALLRFRLANQPSEP